MILFRKCEGKKNLKKKKKKRLMDFKKKREEKKCLVPLHFSLMAKKLRRIFPGEAQKRAR